jgi:hypothetical protein
MVLSEQQIKDYLITEIKFWKTEFSDCVECGVGYEEAFLALVCFRNIYEKIFGEEDYTNMYIHLYDDTDAKK